MRACTFHFKPLLHTPPGMLKRFIGDHRSQKRVLCLSGGMSTDVIAVVNIFLAQGSDMLREKNLQPFDLVVPAHSWVLCLVLPGTLEKGWPLSRRCWRPWVCAHPRPRAVAPEPPCWPPAREDPVRDHAACGIQVPSMRCRCAGLQCSVLQQAYAKSIPGLGRALGQINQSRDLSWKRDVPALNLPPWPELQPVGEWHGDAARPSCSRFPISSFALTSSSGVRTIEKKKILTQDTYSFELGWVSARH